MAVKNIMIGKKRLVLAMFQQLDLHIADLDRVGVRINHHYTLAFFRNYLPVMTMVLCRYVQFVDYLKPFKIDECLLVHPKESGANVHHVRTYQSVQ